MFGLFSLLYCEDLVEKVTPVGQIINEILLFGVQARVWLLRDSFLDLLVVHLRCVLRLNADADTCALQIFVLLLELCLQFPNVVLETHGLGLVQ